MTINDKRYPKDWDKVSKRAIDRAKDRCQECDVKSGIIVKQEWLEGTKVSSIVSEKDFGALKSVAERRKEKERLHLTREQLDDFMSRHMLAELVKHDPSWTVVVDPDEHFGYYQEGTYYPYPDDDYDSKYARAARELKALGLTRIILQTHHKDENPSNCDESNLVVLCQFCHGAKHGKPRRSRVRKRKAVGRHSTTGAVRPQR